MSNTTQTHYAFSFAAYFGWEIAMIRLEQGLDAPAVIEFNNLLSGEEFVSLMNEWADEFLDVAYEDDSEIFFDGKFEDWCDGLMEEQEEEEEDT